MPIAEVETPDGKIMTLEVPEGATQEQIIAFAEANYTPGAPIESQQAQQAQPQAPAPSFYDQLRESLMGGLAGPIQAIPAFEGQVMNTVNNLALSAVDTVPNLINAVTSEANRFRNVRAMDNYDPNNGQFIPTQASQVPTAQGTLGQVGIGNQNYLPEGSAANYIAQFLGTGMVAGAGAIPVASRNLATAPGAIAEFTGFGSKAPLAPAAAAAESLTSPSPVVNSVDSNMDWGVPQGPLPVNKGRTERFLDWTIDRTGSKAREAAPELARGGTNEVAAGFKLEPVSNPGVLNATDQALFDAGLLNRAVADPLQQEVLKQGFPEPLTAMVNTWNFPTRKAAVQMLSRLRSAKGNMADTGRPSDVIGDLFDQRIDVVFKNNQMAANKLKEEANALRGTKVDISAPLTEFDDSLREWGVKITPKTGKLNFDTSMFRGKQMGDLRGVIEDIYNRVHKPTGKMLNGPIDAYEAHQIKQYIDRSVSYGKANTGLDGQLESVFKGLRRGVDQVLDSNFEGYNNVNSVYSESREAIDAIQDALPNKIDIFAPNANKVLGAETRKFLSNYSSRQGLENSLAGLETLARRYLKEGNQLASAKRIQEITGINAIDDDIVQLSKYNSVLEDMFGTTAQQSAKGIAQSTGSRVASEMLNPKSAVMGYIDENLHKLRGINDKAALDAMEKLLRGGKR